MISQDQALLLGQAAGVRGIQGLEAAERGLYGCFTVLSFDLHAISRVAAKIPLHSPESVVCKGGKTTQRRTMSLFQQAIQLAFPFVEGTDPLILAPVMALVVSFGLIGIFGAFLAVQEFFSTASSK
jgi:hypothetical protein